MPVKVKIKKLLQICKQLYSNYLSKKMRERFYRDIILRLGLLLNGELCNADTKKHQS